MPLCCNIWCAGGVVARVPVCVQDFAKLSAGKRVHGFFASVASRRSEAASAGAGASLDASGGMGAPGQGTPGAMPPDSADLAAHAIPLPNQDKGAGQGSGGHTGGVQGVSLRGTGRAGTTQGLLSSARGLWPMPPCHIAQLGQLVETPATGAHHGAGPSQGEEGASCFLPGLLRETPSHGLDVASLHGSVEVPFMHQWANYLRGRSSNPSPQDMGMARAVLGIDEAPARAVVQPGEEAEDRMWTDRWAPSTLDEVQEPRRC